MHMIDNRLLQRRKLSGTGIHMCIFFPEGEGNEIYIVLFFAQRIKVNEPNKILPVIKSKNEYLSHIDET